MVKNCIVASAVIFNKEGKVLLLKHKKLKTWLYPGGHVKKNEHPDTSVVREVFEETGLRIRIVDALKGTHIADKDAERVPQPLVIMLESPEYGSGMHKHFDLIYLAEVTGGTIKHNRESKDIRWSSEREIKRLNMRFKNILGVIHKAILVHSMLNNT